MMAQDTVVLNQQNQQALANLPHIDDMAAREQQLNNMKEKEKRFRLYGVGSFLYALFYTICLYHNASGITYPFFAGGTLLFFGYCIKKSENSSADGNMEKGRKAHINKIFLMVSIVAAGAINCTTDSGILIFINKLLMFILMGVLLLQCWHDLTGWSVTAYIKGVAVMLLGGISNIFSQIGDLWAVRRLRQIRCEREKDNADRKRVITSVVIGLLIAMPVAVFIGILLASADAVFYTLLSDIFSFSPLFDIFDDMETIINIVFRIVIVSAVCYGIFVYNTEQQNIKKIDDMAVRDQADFDTYIAVTVNGIMCILYLVFSGVQIFGLFLGKMRLPEGYTYAEYARHGFFELVFVSMFNILLVLFTLAYFKNSVVLKILLTIICGCTYIMTLSSAYRMLLYISSYRLTFLRLFVLWALAVIAIVMTGVLVYVHVPGFSLFRFGLMIVTAGWLSFAAIHPDYWIASYNIMTSDESSVYDDYYLKKKLSLDAVSALPEEIYKDERSIYYRRAKVYQQRVSGFWGKRKFNFSRNNAVYKIFK